MRDAEMYFALQPLAIVDGAVNVARVSRNASGRRYAARGRWNQWVISPPSSAYGLGRRSPNRCVPAVILVPHPRHVARPLLAVSMVCGMLPPPVGLSLKCKLHA